MQNDLYLRYGISNTNGFLPHHDPLQQLPPYFSAWDAIGAELPNLILAGTLRRELEKMPSLEVNRLQSNEEQERAMLLLSFFAHAYLRSDSPELFKLPSNIAVPWSKVAANLGRPTVLAHASAVLNNWRRINPDLPIGLNNLALLQPYQGGMDEAWFFLVTAAIEKEGSQIVNAVVELLQGKADTFTVQLDKIAVCLGEMTALLQRMPEKCEPLLFYHRLRPFLGSLNNVLFEGVSSDPMKLSGGSAAQSSLIQCIDAAIGIKHEEPRSAGFLLEMRKFMPEKHREFLLYIENSGCAKSLSHTKHLNKLTDLKSKLEDFRAEHLKIYYRYVASQQKKTALGDTGTGGTDAIEFLKQIKKDSE
jgi:indoleamine 2,3-dioxygenase